MATGDNTVQYDPLHAPYPWAAMDLYLRHMAEPLHPLIRCEIGRVALRSDDVSLPSNHLRNPDIRERLEKVPGR